MKTAVEWYSEQLKYNLGRIVINQDWQLFDKIIQDAIDIEKLQIMDAWNNRAGFDGVLTYTDNRTAEDYYNETFKKEL
jgi:hypothetical protein